jgi:hypothetical protein
MAVEYRLTLRYDTEPGGTGTPLPWGEPEAEVEKALREAGATEVGYEGGTALQPGMTRDVSLYVDELDLIGIKEVLSQFPHGPFWDVDVVDDEETS